MTAPDIVKKLVQRFEEHRDAYRSGKYNETQLRREFLDPLFEALGWDIFNKQGYAEMYKDVIHEDSLEIEGENKAPDYAFRIGGTRKFFVEAKKPAVNIEFNIHPAFQLRRYAWSAKLPLSILTDFEEFAIYDCRVKPDKGDKASTGRVKLYSFKDYIEKWDEIAAIFSRDALLKGSFDSYAEGLKGKKGTTEVDDAFLAEIERWRELLAKNIALRNPALSVRELNYAVQMTIDRIVFLRICEDRGVERDEQLKEISEGKNIYPALVQLFQRADTRYNSGLFHFRDEKEQSSGADTLTLQLKIDDKVLHDILSNLYYPESPYVFREIPADILGQVYERFLGKVIRLTASHQAKVEEKPEVRKAGGVYYTPTYIVDYIVQNTVGKLLEGKTPKDAAKLKILDPACGSGTFPLGAYQYLLDWHLKWYVENEPTQWAAGKNPAIYEGAENKGIGDKGKGSWYLTTAKKKEILLNNIYGVDIDAQAVEVTKLSLLLKVLEGENQETIGSQLSLLQERVLPDLGKNIQCGNSLIGPDYYESHQLTMGFADDEERYRVNAFDWKGAFPQVFLQGGFDVVIGNPPYVRQETLGEQFKLYAKKHFQTFVSTADLYTYFIEKSHILLKDRGRFGMICSNKFMRSNYGKALREYIASNLQIIQIVDFGELPVFENASTFPVILLTVQNKPSKQEFDYAPIKRLSFLSLSEEVASIKLRLTESSIRGGEWTLLDEKGFSVFEKVQNIGTSLGDYTNKDVYFGIKTGYNAGFVITRQLLDSIINNEPQSVEHIKPFVFGDDVRKYQINFRNEYLIRIPKGWTNAQKPQPINAWEWLSKKHPLLASHLLQFKDTAEKRQDQGDYWWELRACDYYDKMEIPKIVYPDIAKESRVAFDKDGLYFSNTVYFIPRNDLYLLGILNSRLIFSYFKRIASVLGDPDKGGRLRWFRQDVMRLPIRTINFSDPTDKAQHDKMVSFVERMLALHKQTSRTPQEQEMVKREIESTDKAIDRLVYELYGLNEEEIKIVEG